MLAELVEPLPTVDFLDAWWPERPYWSNEGSARLVLLAHIPELTSAEAAFRGAPFVNVFQPDGRTLKLPPDEATIPYRLGLTCFVGCAHVPSLKELAEDLASDLGMPSGSMAVEIFCTDGPSGTPLHSDHDDNFAVLVRGSKTWHVAPNRHIRNQTALCRPVAQEEHDPRQLELADRLPFPSKLPDDATAVDIDAGGVLFLPRGWWHRTSTRGECLQVNFVVARHVWASVLTVALGRRLERDPAWRAFAYDVFADDARRDRALAIFAGLLDGLRADLGSVPSVELAAQLIADAGLVPAPRQARS